MTEFKIEDVRVDTIRVPNECQNITTIPMYKLTHIPSGKTLSYVPTFTIKNQSKMMLEQLKKMVEGENKTE